MYAKIGLGILAVVILFSIFVVTREAKFHYERSGVIAASKEQIFPYISNLRMGELWSPYEKDTEMKKSFSGEDGQVGSKMIFESKKSGSGSVEITQIVPNERVQIRLTMTAPFHADNIVEYKLTSEASGTRFSWAMWGDSGFMGKALNIFIDCEKMVGNQMLEGISSLKSLMEKPK